MLHKCHYIGIFLIDIKIACISFHSIEIKKFLIFFVYLFKLLQGKFLDKESFYQIVDTILLLIIITELPSVDTLSIYIPKSSELGITLPPLS